MQCQDRIFPWRNAQLRQDFGFLDLAARSQKRIDHDVPDKKDVIIGYSLALEIGDAAWLTDKEPAADRVGQYPIDLFRHFSIEASQSGFDMGDGDIQFRGDQGA